MMPIIGIPPYDGPLESTLANLRTDPTHNLLHNRAWWLERWSRLGWHAVPVNILMEADNTFFEFSTCQLLLSRKDPDTDLLRSVQDFNLSFFQRVSLWDLARSADSGGQARTLFSLGTILRGQSLPLRKGNRGELSHDFSVPVDLRDATLYLFSRVEAPGPLNLRLAAVTFKEGAGSSACDPGSIAGVAQLAVKLAPGYSAVELRLADFSPLYGSPRPQDVSMLMFGGESRFPAVLECIGVLKSPAGSCQLRLRPYSHWWARVRRYIVRLMSRRAA
jgi:hypothetical protein